VVLLAPVLGILADRAGHKKRLLLLLASLGALMSGCLFLVAEGAWLVAAAIYVFGIIGFAGGNVAYDAMLLDIAEDDELERLSALGFALGYLGGGLLFAVNVVMVLQPAWFGLADQGEAVRYAFLMVAVWWAVFTLPLLLFVPANPARGRRPDAGLVTGFGELRETWSLLRSLPMAFLFLVAYWFYIDGVDTIDPHGGRLRPVARFPGRVPADRAADHPVRRFPGGAGLRPDR
jgi:MFS transporter, UMF1 family